MIRILVWGDKIVDWMVLYSASFQYSHRRMVVGSGMEDSQEDAQEAAFQCAERFCLNHAC